ncbi:MAG: hypothetical protein KBD19_02580 [Candidatus Moranbacteria bacterium]|nr:hypothetical protein [Candidatus Moranbacteria bacterium]
MKTVLSAVALCIVLSSCGSENPPPDEFWKDGISVRFEKTDRVYVKPFNFFVMRSVRVLGMETVKPGGYEASCTVIVSALDPNPPKDIELSCNDYRLSREGRSGVVSRRFASEDEFIRGFSEFASGIAKKGE